MITPLGTLANEIPVGGRADPAVFDAEGYAVGRGVLDPEVLRKLRAPLIEALVADGQVEADDNEDRFVWCGDKEAFGRVGYWRHLGDVDELLVASGVVGKAIEAVWGRRAMLWVGRVNLYVMIPGDPDRVHRDGWQMLGIGGPGDHLNIWMPLTRLGANDGPLAIAIGSHRISDGPAEVPMPHAMHSEVSANTGNLPSPEVLGPLWRTTSFEVGDALAFRPDIVHSASANTGPYLRLAVGIGALDPRPGLPPLAGLSLDPGRDLVDVEWLTLAVLAVQPCTRWLAQQAFSARGIIGRRWAVHFELVARSFTTLQARGFIEAHETDRYFCATASGRAAVSNWLMAPSSDDLESVKTVFCDWLGLDERSVLTDQDGSSSRSGDL